MLTVVPPTGRTPASPFLMLLFLLSGVGTGTPPQPAEHLVPPTPRLGTQNQPRVPQQSPGRKNQSVIESYHGRFQVQGAPRGLHSPTTAPGHPGQTKGTLSSTLKLSSALCCWGLQGAFQDRRPAAVPWEPSVQPRSPALGAFDTSFHSAPGFPEFIGPKQCSPCKAPSPNR